MCKCVLLGCFLLLSAFCANSQILHFQSCLFLHLLWSEFCYTFFFISLEDESNANLCFWWTMSESVWKWPLNIDWHFCITASFILYRQKLVWEKDILHMQHLIPSSCMVSLFSSVLKKSLKLSIRGPSWGKATWLILCREMRWSTI